MRKGSIAFSLFWLSAAWLILALVGTAFLLTDLYSRALDSNLSNQLRFNIDTISSGTLDSTDPDFRRHHRHRSPLLSRLDRLVLGDPRRQ